MPWQVSSNQFPRSSNLCHCLTALVFAIAVQLCATPLRRVAIPIPCKSVRFPPHCCSSPHTAPRCHCTTTLCSARALLCLSELFQRKSLQVLRTASLFSSITLLVSSIALLFYSFAPRSGAFPEPFCSIPWLRYSLSKLIRYDALPRHGFAKPTLITSKASQFYALPCRCFTTRHHSIPMPYNSWLCRYITMPLLCNAFRSNAEASHLLFPALSRVSFPLHFYALAQLNMFSPKSIRTPQNKKPLKSISVPPPYENFPTTDFPFFAIKHCRKARQNTIFDVSIGFPGKARPMDACCPCPISDTHG